MLEILHSSLLLLTLLNPFLIVIYLLDVIEKLPPQQFRMVLLRAGIISTCVFCIFAVVGDSIFSSLIHAEFASFQIFGGVIFLIIGLQFVFKGPKTIEILRGESSHIAGAIAMPVLIGPGTVSASVVIGKRLDPIAAVPAIVVAVAVCVGTISALKSLHDHVRSRNEPLVERYIEIAGRISALVIGTIAMEMIMQGLRTWVGKL